MGANNRRSSPGHVAARFAYFGIAAAIAVVMILTALVVWLTELTGSVIATTLIIGGFFAVLAAVIYQLAIRDAVAEIREQMQTVYEATSLVKMGYEWAAEKLALFMRLREK